MFSNSNNHLPIKKVFSYIVLIVPFVLYGLRTTSHLSPNPSLQFVTLFSDTNIFAPFLKINNFFLQSIFILSSKFFLLLSPILGITIFELYSIRQKLPLKDKLQKTSLGKIIKSEGFKYADVWYFFFHLIKASTPVIIVFLTLGSDILLKGLETQFHNLYKTLIPFPTSNISIAFIFIVALLLKDLMFYLSHKICHRFPLIWEFHEFHHSATEMTILNKDRETPLQKIFSAPLIIPISVFVGLLINEYMSMGYIFPLYLFLIDTIIKTLSEYLGHSSSKVIYPKPISYIFMSPALHWIHHSKNPKHYDSNFGMHYIFWDKMFGTYVGEDSLKDIYGFGVEGTEYNKYHPMYASIFLPINKLFKRIKKSYIH